MASPVPLAAALPPMSDESNSQTASTDIAMKVVVEGETIDNALITSKGRGTAPQMWREIDRLTGATTGFDRD